ncbi:hypothetical protein [Streptomyces sp. ICBB 8177]|uniref:hypothetical protein n=1 Tax=Streptomyces sp. ICBB 8177 TaxID=563922 RepID=UPI000D682F45|nr:hypothetical protein [Streptomyces sp. ICBB 8177]PWI41070.1 hypothetical protein CK485_27275 [Streptomyces sp. ICBB 8177]
MAIGVSSELRDVLEEPFGGTLGDPRISFREIEFDFRNGRLVLVGVVVVSRAKGDETWKVTLSFEEADHRSALDGAPRAALEWFALMVRENVMEWWHTRRQGPNMPFAAQKIAHDSGGSS